MRKSLITLLLILFVLPCTLGQQLNSEKRAKQETYLEISQRQQKTGWILLGTGAATTVIGIAAFSNSWDSGSDSTTDLFGFVMLGGLISTFSSIPFFISSGVNKRRANRIAFSIYSQPYMNFELTGLTLKPQPAIKIAFNF